MNDPLKPRIVRGSTLFTVPADLEATLVGWDDHARLLLDALRARDLYDSAHLYRGTVTNLQKLLVNKTDMIGTDVFMAFDEDNLFDPELMSTPFGYLDSAERDGTPCILVYRASAARHIPSAGVYGYAFLNAKEKKKSLVAVFAYERVNSP